MVVFCSILYRTHFWSISIYILIRHFFSSTYNMNNTKVNSLAVMINWIGKVYFEIRFPHFIFRKLAIISSPDTVFLCGSLINVTKNDCFWSSIFFRIITCQTFSMLNWALGHRLCLRGDGMECRRLLSTSIVVENCFVLCELGHLFQEVTQNWLWK